MSYQFGKFLSNLQFYFSFRDRKAVYNNLLSILGPRNDLHALTQEVFRNFGRYLVEFFRMGKNVDRDFIKKNVTVEHLERLEDALKKNRGGIALTAHLGNWELGSVVTTLLGYPLFIIALPHKERPVNDLFNYQREVKGITVVPTYMAVRRCYEELKNNKMIALAVDRDFSASGEVMDFLGKKTLIPKGAALFSLRTGAPMIPIFLIREKENQFRLIVCEPIEPPEEMIGSSDNRGVLSLMKRYVAVIEEYIRRYPTQWLMFRQYWIDDSIDFHDMAASNGKAIKDNPSSQTTIFS